MNGTGSRLHETAPNPADPAVLGEADVLDRAGRHREAIALLSRAASGGDLAAKRMVGVRILLGDRAPLMGADGVRLLSEAAMQGDAESADLTAVLVAAGIYCRQDWKHAFDWLQLAAELGSLRAQGSLRTLCSDPHAGEKAGESGQPTSIWGNLRADIDMAALVAPAAGRLLNEEPYVQAYGDFASTRICDWLISRSHGHLTRAKVYNPEAGRIVQTQERTNTAAIFNLLQTDLVQIAVQARIAASLGVSFAQLEPAAVLHYSVGEVFEDHYDFVDPEIPNYEQEIARDGQRVITFLVYLNGGYEGGETDFPLLGVSHRGNTGEGLSFVNALPDGSADTRTLHAGRAPLSGEKWVLSQFIRNRSIVPGV